jgi:hypothetical protein
MLFLCGGTNEGSESFAVIGAAIPEVHVLNYDTANGEQYDLLEAATQRRLLRELSEGQFTFVFASPLCRTYSIVHSPSLRSPAHPRGLPNLPERYRALVDNDTRLALFTLRVLARAAELDIPWAFEHPSPRDDPASPAHWPRFAEQGTIWHYAAMQALLAASSTDNFDFAQCARGSSFQNHTRIAGHRAFTTAARPLLHAGERCTCAKHAQL